MFNRLERVEIDHLRRAILLSIENGGALSASGRTLIADE
jgi:hypothetical protein